ncbi:MAG: YIP1 family protein [Candidatus Omnitrophota bacterium]
MENLAGSTAQKSTIPWQERRSLGFFRASWETIKYVLLRPGEFFDNLEIKNSIKEPYLFYLLVTLVTSIISLVVEIFIKQGLNFSGFVPASTIILLFVLVGIFVGSALLHLAVMLLGGKGGFKGTFNVLAYNASSGIFSVIPFVGVIIGGIWGIVVGVKGFKRVHNFSTTRAVIAYLGLFFIVAIIGLLAAIAVPNLLRARLAANEAQTRATVKMISTAIETYVVANNGQFPLSEADLKKENYLSENYGGSTKSGYDYSVSFKQDSYKIIAAPRACGTTGVKVFMTQTGEALTEKNCK